MCVSVCVPGSCGLLQHMSVEMHGVHDDLVGEGVGEGYVTAHTGI